MQALKAVKTPVSLAFVPVVVGALFLAAPHVHLPAGAVDVLTFGGACSTAIVALVLLSRAPVYGRVRLPLGLVAAVALGGIALSRTSSPVAVIAIGAALVTIAHLVGDFIGSHIEHPGHILPACVVAACIDVTSVFHPSGPTHAVIASPRALALLAISFPVLGTSQHAPVIGIGDLLFISLLLGVARAHSIRWWKVALAAMAGVGLAGFASAMFEAAVPALPAIGAATIVGVREMRSLRPKDRRVSVYFMIGAVVLASVTLASRFLLAPPS